MMIPTILKRSMSDSTTTDQNIVPSCADTEHNNISPMSPSPTPSLRMRNIRLSPGGDATSYKSVSPSPLQTQINEKESQLLDLVNLNASSLKAGLFRGRISPDEYDSHMDDLMSQVKDISSEISLIRNKITTNKKDILFLQDDKIKHDNDIISLKVNVEHCSDRIKEYTDDSHLHSKTIKTTRQGQVQVKQDIKIFARLSLRTTLKLVQQVRITLKHLGFHMTSNLGHWLNLPRKSIFIGVNSMTIWRKVNFKVIVPFNLITSGIVLTPFSHQRWHVTRALEIMHPLTLPRLSRHY